MNLHEVVLKLAGPIRPVGETREDERRLQNIAELTILIDKLLFDIADVASAADRPEHSMKLIGQHAEEFMAAIGQHAEEFMAGFKK